MTQFKTKGEVKAALKTARKLLAQANKTGDRTVIQHRLRACEQLSDLLDSWRGK